MGNAIFAGSSGVVGIAATNVQLQNVVVLGDINTSGTAIPTLTFGTSSQFGSPRIAGGDLQNTNVGNFSGFSSVEYTAGTDSAGRVIPAQGIDNKAPTAVSLSNTVSSLAEDASTASRVKVADIAVTDDGRGTNSLALSGADASKFELVGNALFLKAGTALNFESQTSYAVTVSASDSTVAGSSAVSTSYALGVTNVNETPSITSSGSVSTIEDTAIAFTVVGADVDAGTTLTYSAGSAAKGTITGGTNGAFVYTPNANANGADSFVVTVSDGTLSTTQTVNVAITAVNDNPVAVADAVASVVLGNATSINVLANDTDVDGNALSLTGTPTVNVGTVTIVGGALNYVAPANYVGQATINYSITDGTATVSATQTVNVTQPTISRSAESVNEGASATFTINGAPNTDYAISLTGSATPGTDYAGAALAQVTTDGAGVATFTLTPSLDKSTEGAETVTASVVGFTGSQTISIADASVDNVAPAFTSSASETATEDTVKTFTVAATDGNAEDMVTYSLGAVTGGTATLSGGTVTFTPTANYNGAASVIVNATDGTASVAQEVTIAVGAVNDAPTLAAVSAQAATEDTVLTFSVMGADVDAGDVLAYSAAGATKGSVSVASDGTVTYTPTADLNGSDSFTITVTDKAGLTATQSVSVAIAAVNDAPVASTIAAQTARQDTAFSLNASTAFSDVDAGAVLTYSAAGLPAGLTINATTGVISGTPTLATVEAGTASIVVTATDNASASTSAAAFNLTTAASYTIAASSVTSVNEGASVTYTITNTARTLGEVITYTIVPTNASSADFDAGLTGQTTFNASGQATITIGVTADTLTEAGAETFSVNFAYSGNSVVRAGAITVNDTSVTGDLSRELTAGADTGANFTLGVGNDTFNGRTTANSLNTSDVLSGGAGGTDTVTAILNQTGGINVRPTLTSIETVEISNTNAAGGADTATVDLASATGVTTVRSLQSTDNVTFTNVGSLASVEASITNANLTVNYTDAALAGANSVSLRLDNADGITVAVGNSTAGGTNVLETINANFAVNVDGTPAATITGASNVVVTSSIEGSTTDYTLVVSAGADASALTKRINLSNGAAGTLIGGSAADSITGSAGADSISGNAGNDTLNGGGGADTLNGGEGNDTYQFSTAANLTAGRISDASGSNTISMTAAVVVTDAAFVNKTGAATLTLAAGVNTVTLDANALAAGITTVNAGAGGDTITVTAGHTGAIALVGAAGNDSLTGNSGADTITLGAGQDTAIGGNGDDTIVGAGNVTDLDSIVGGAGTDTLTLAGSTTLTAANLISGVENYTLNSRGVSSTTLVTGYTYVVAIDNDNDPDAAVTTDTLTVNASGLLLDVNSTDAGNQSETLNFDGSGVTTNFKVSVTGGSANDTLVGGSLADTLVGGSGSDSLTGGAGVDNMDGGEGADTYLYGTSTLLGEADTINDSGTSGTDTISLTNDGNVADAAFLNMRGVETFTATVANGNSFTLGANAQTAGIATINLAAGNVLAAGAYTSALSIVASTGNETITAGGGNDTITIGTGNDNVSAGNGDDTVVGAANVTAADTLAGGAGTDVLTVNGGGAATTIVFNGNFTGFERINAAAGAEAVAVAGAANDTLPTINDYTFTLVDTNVAAASTFTVDASALRTGIITNFGADGEIGGTGGNADTTAGAENLNLDASALTGTRAVSVMGGADADTVAGGAGADYITSNGGADTLTGNGGADTLLGGDGNDTLNGGAGADSLDGGAGNDTFQMTVNELNNDNDTVAGGAGTNTLQVTTTADVTVADVAFNARFTDITNVNLEGTAGGATEHYTWTLGSYSNAAGVRTVSVGASAEAIIDANAYGSAVTLTGNAGNDTLTGSAFADSLTGGAGNDQLNGGDGADSISGGAGANVISAGAGADTITLGVDGVNNENVDAGTGDDTVIGGANVTAGDTLAGGTGTDLLTLNGGGAATTIVFDGDFTAFERINVAAGAEAVAVAGAANDTLPTINDYTLTLVDANVAAASTFTVDASALRTGIITNFGADGEIGGTGGNADTTAGAENLNLDASALTGTRAVSVMGGADADTVAGGAGADVISGNGGADSLTGNDGADTLSGGAGNDTLTGGAGIDRLTGDAGNDVFVFTAASESTGASADSITDFTTGADKIQVNLSGDFSFDASGFSSVSSFSDGLVSLSLAHGDAFYSSADGKLYVDVDGNGTISQGADYVISAATVASGDVNFSLTGGASANTITGGAGNDIIDAAGGIDSIVGGAGSDRLTGGAAADTFVLTSTSGTDTITDFTAGAGGDVLQVDISDLGLAGSDHFEGLATAVNATGSQEIVVLTASYADDASAAAAIAATVTTDGLAMVIVYHNTTTGHVHVIHTTNSNTGANVTHLATLDNITTLVGLTATDATNFGGRP